MVQLVKRVKRVANGLTLVVGDGGLVTCAVCDVHRLVLGKARCRHRRPSLTRLTAALTAATTIDVVSVSAATATDAHPKLAVNV